MNSELVSWIENEEGRREKVTGREKQKERWRWKVEVTRGGGLELSRSPWLVSPSSRLAQGSASCFSKGFTSEGLAKG
jgi:hypothetical protein